MGICYLCTSCFLLKVVIGLLKIHVEAPRSVLSCDWIGCRLFLGVVEPFDRPGAIAGICNFFDNWICLALPGDHYCRSPTRERPKLFCLHHSIALKQRLEK